MTQPESGDAGNETSRLASPALVGATSGPQAMAPAGGALTIVIPTYNEAENLRAMVETLLALDLPALQILVVDDNSPDGTGDVADALALAFNDPASPRPRVKVLHRPAKAGLGTAYVAGMTAALADGVAYVVQMDADFSHSPAYIPQMLGVLESMDADVVIGSRYVPGGSLDERWSWWRRFVSWWANLYSRAILGLRIRDMTAGFKLWRCSALEAIGLQNVQSNGYSFQVEMAFLSEKLGLRIVEVPIHFEDRRIGQSKLDIPVKIESAWRTWQIRWRYRKMPSHSPSLVTAPLTPAQGIASVQNLRTPAPSLPDSFSDQSVTGKTS